MNVILILCFPDSWFGNEAASSSFLSLSLPSGADCKNIIPTTPTTIKVFHPSEREVCFCLLLCTQEEPQTEPPEATATADGKQETESETCGGGKMLGTEERRSVGGAIERLGLELLSKLPTGPQQPNVILSPLSVALALAQLTLGR